MIVSLVLDLITTNHAIISLTEGIKTSLDSGQLVAGVFLDLRKAFDTVNHEILIQKLLRYGFRGKAASLLKSFLGNRRQYVSINGYDSEILDIKCGIPQGSTLGPLLFLLYINDLRFCLEKSQASHFADDTCMTFKHRSLKVLEFTFNRDLENVSTWLKANRLSLNVEKTKLLIFHSKHKMVDESSVGIKLSGHNLKPSDDAKYLGMMLDKNLSWDSHIHNLRNKLGRANGVISKLRHFVPVNILTSIYYAIFHSQVLYGCNSWSLTSFKNIDAISVLQKKCIRIMNFAPYNSHSNGLFLSNNIVKLTDTLRNEKIKLAFLFQRNFLPVDLMSLFHRNENKYNTRNMSKGGLCIPKINSTVYGERTLRFSVPSLWNEFIKYNDVNNFDNLNQLKRHLKKNLF